MKCDRSHASSCSRRCWRYLAISLDLHGQSSIGIHFGLIDNAGESYDAPVDDLVVTRRTRAVDATHFVVAHYGQVFKY